MTKIQWVFDRIISKATYKLRYAIVFIGFGTFFFNLWSVYQINIDKDIPQVLVDTHPIQKAFNWGKNELYRKETIIFGINWGVGQELILNPN